jgi:hypothetical protein
MSDHQIKATGNYDHGLITIEMPVTDQTNLSFVTSVADLEQNAELIQDFLNAAGEGILQVIVAIADAAQEAEQ